MDHVHAVAAREPHEATNLIACCSACNNMLSRSGARRTIEKRQTFVNFLKEQERKYYEHWLRVRDDTQAMATSGSMSGHQVPMTPTAARSDD